MYFGEQFFLSDLTWAFGRREGAEIERKVAQSDAYVGVKCGRTKGTFPVSEGLCSLGVGKPGTDGFVFLYRGLSLRQYSARAKTLLSLLFPLVLCFFAVLNQSINGETFSLAH